MDAGASHISSRSIYFVPCYMPGETHVRTADASRQKLETFRFGDAAVLHTARAKMLTEGPEQDSL